MTDPNPPAGSNPQQDSQGTPPPRPGQNVPEGGLDPTQVFASPPPPPPPPPTQGDSGAASAQAQKKDAGPPPPPPGPLPSDEELKAKGYDDEDIRILKEVGDYRFSTIGSKITNDNIIVPAHPETHFDEQMFLTLLRGSISLTRDEKWRIIQAIPKLSQFQIDELQKILDEEKKKFSQLSPKHLLQLMKLEQKHAEDWKDLQSITLQEGAKQQEEQQAEDIRKQLGL
ncbi:hypothetical protein COU75_04165 [Candidatus Peregrinibacteria bacterium CG10_big_fil_rev_8_21_14_0_10_42_8]|nr:MAG: hypothetical protein COU75_04165 [Candidatus Peregrinibacteria bacterium CG10_big_fil_rev_8_21_14_0_10_42_8]